MNSIDQLEHLANLTRCPAWCEGVDCTLDSEPGDALHQARMPDVGHTKTTIWSHVSATGPANGPKVDVLLGEFDTHHVESLGAQDCRDLAAALLVAAERLDEIAGAR